VSFFVLSSEIEDRHEVEIDNWAKRKKTSTLRYILFYLQADHKKKSDMNSLIYFSFSVVALKLQSSNLLFLNFKAIVIFCYWYLKFR
jgi:hypothetical protein